MKMMVLLATLALCLPYGIGWVAGHYGAAVAARFLERPDNTIPPEEGKTIPADEKSLTATNLSKWVQNNSVAARGYATRVIPFDIIWLLCLGGFFALASAWAASQVAWQPITALPPISAWWLCVWWILPGLFIASDVIEDVTIAALLLRPDAIGGGFSFMRAITTIKLCAVGAAFAQVLALLALTRIG